MASPSITGGAFQEMQRNAAENARLAQEHQRVIGMIQADTKTASTNSKNSMTAINDTSDLASAPLNQAYKAA